MVALSVLVATGSFSSPDCSVDVAGVGVVGAVVLDVDVFAKQGLASHASVTVPAALPVVVGCVVTRVDTVVDIVAVATGVGV